MTTSTLYRSTRTQPQAVEPIIDCQHLKKRFGNNVVLNDFNITVDPGENVVVMGRSGIGVVWQEFVHPTYPQRYGKLGFSSHLGFLDLLFNYGPASRDLLFGVSHPLHAHVLKQPVDQIWGAV